ncbi:AEC family transporter [Candidatus Omnitrophota bacterium]
MQSLQITITAVAQIFVLGAIGYFLVKKGRLGTACLDTLSRLVIEVTLPLMIFCQLARKFSFSQYPDWWIFPLISILITGSGLLLGSLFGRFASNPKDRGQFTSLIAFQNSGYLPLALVAALLSGSQADTMFIYLFLFLLGFNASVWSLGVYLLAPSRSGRLGLARFFSPPVIATILGLLFVFAGADRFFPQALYRPLSMVGDCTLPLALFVVGGNLARVHLGSINKRAMAFMVLLKLIALPALGLGLIIRFNLPELIGLLILIELAVPPATSLSLITSHYREKDKLISQGIFFGHIVSIITIPVFLSLYFMLVMVK